MANTSFYGKLQDHNMAISWRDLLSESFKKHSRMDRDRLLAVGTSAWKVNDGNMLSKWRKPWLWSRLLLAFAVMAALNYIGIKVFAGAPAFYTIAMVLIPTMLPITELVFLWELNIPQNLSLWDVMLYFFLGGILSLLVSHGFFVLLYSIYPELGQIAPLAEEPGKLIAILLLLNIVKKRNSGKIYGITGLVIGAAVGAGFAAFESIMYVLREYGVNTVYITEGIIYSGVEEYTEFDVAAFGMDSSMDVLLYRLLSALGGHIQYAAPYAAAIVFGSAEGKRSGLLTGRFLLAFGMSCLMHALWNMAESIGAWILLIILLWGILLYWINRCLKEVYAAGTSPSASMPVIHWLYGPFAGQNFTVTTGAPIHIGRALDNQLVFPKDTAGVSRHHCVLRANSQLTIEDCNSTSGTFVDGQKLVPNKSYELKSGQKVALGSNKNSFSVM